MKTTNVILLGVVGVGAVGAYMYMKNKKAENALLSGSLPAPASNQGGATPPLVSTDATVLLGQRAVLEAQRKAPYLPNSGQYSASDYRQFFEGKASAKRKIIEIDKKLASLGYKVNDSGELVSTASDGVSPSDANINLTNANALAGKIPNVKARINQKCGFTQKACMNDRNNAKNELPKLESQLASLGYKYDNGLLVKI